MVGGLSACTMRERGGGFLSVVVGEELTMFCSQTKGSRLCCSVMTAVHMFRHWCHIVMKY